jgi:PAT family beta-lactamase induction signal transducer AmpG
MAADGLFVTSLSAEEQARYVGWLSVAFNVGKFVVQGLIVVFAGWLEARKGVIFAWRAALASLGAIMAALACYHANVLPLEPAPRAAESFANARAKWADVMKSFFTGDTFGWLALLIVLYRLGEGLTVRIVPLFLLDPRARGGLAFSTAELGVLYGGIGVGAFMIGALAGGALSAKVGIERSLFALYLAFNLPATMYLLLAWLRPVHPAVAAGAIAVEQLAYGVGFVGLKLAMMQSLSDGPYRTAHFAFATSLSGFASSLAGMASGWAQTLLGYRGLFLLALIAAAPGLAVIRSAFGEGAPHAVWRRRSAR